MNFEGSSQPVRDKFTPDIVAFRISFYLHIFSATEMDFSTAKIYRILRRHPIAGCIKTEINGTSRTHYIVLYFVSFFLTYRGNFISAAETER